MPPKWGHNCGGEQPPNFTVMGITECEACLHRRGKDTKWAEAAVVSRGTTTPLLPHQCIHLELPTGTLSRYGNPPPPLAGSQNWVFCLFIVSDQGMKTNLILENVIVTAQC